MTRAQLILDDDTYEALRATAFRSRHSLSATARELLREALHLGPSKRPAKHFSFVACGASGKKDNAAERHDEVLGETGW